MTTFTTSLTRDEDGNGYVCRAYDAAGNLYAEVWASQPWEAEDRVRSFLIRKHG